jgi:hypothetical protein
VSHHHVRPIHSGYSISFTEDDLDTPYMAFDVTYIDAISWGLMATVTVRSNIEAAHRLPGDILLMDRVNLMRNRDLKDMAMRIDALVPPPKSAGRMDWQHHLEHVAVLVNAEQQRPVPVLELSGLPLPDPQRFDIPGLLARGKANILYGPGGTGKSVLALRMAGSVATGVECFGFDVYRTGPVLYLDWEDDADTLVSRLDAVSIGMGLNRRFDLGYKCLRGRGPYERHAADVRYAVEQDGISLVIFDSTAMAMAGSTAGDGADGAIKFMDLVSQLGATALLIDHIASDDIKHGEGAPKPYGSVFKVNAARNMWEVRPWKPGDLTGMTLRHRKTNVGPPMPDADVSVTWTDGSIRFRRVYEELAPVVRLRPVGA